MQLFMLIYNTYNSLKPPGSYVYRQIWHQEVCTLPAEFVYKVRGFHDAHNGNFVSCRLPVIEPPLSDHPDRTSEQRLKYFGAPWGSAKFSNPSLRSRPITKIIIPLGFILRSWPTRMSSISVWHAVRHFMLSHVTSCRLLGKVRRLGGCYGNCRVQPLVYCDESHAGWYQNKQTTYMHEIFSFE